MTDLFSADIATLKAQLDSKTAQAELKKLKSQLPNHWSSPRTWVAVIGIAAALFFFRHDTGTIISQILPAAKDIIVAFLWSSALVEASSAIAAAIRTPDATPAP
jgi:hypothetical protein